MCFGKSGSVQLSNGIGSDMIRRLCLAVLVGLVFVAAMLLVGGLASPTGKVARAIEIAVFFPAFFATQHNMLGANNSSSYKLLLLIDVVSYSVLALAIMSFLKRGSPGKPRQK